MSSKFNILKYICILQFIGPIFVILGHSVNGINVDTITYLFTKKWIYIFHMPLFFFVSGYLLSHKGWLRNASYLEFIQKKYTRLVVPYLFWNLLFILPKYLVQGYLSDNVMIQPLLIFEQFITPRQNIWGHTWFLVALFIIFLFTPIFKKICDSNKTIIYMILFILILAYMIPMNSELFCISDLHKDLLFFYIGTLIGNIKVDFLKSLSEKYTSIISTFAVIASLFFTIVDGCESFNFVPCTLIIIMFFLIAIKYENNDIFKNVEVFAGYSFGIYILHWPVMVTTRIIFFQVLHLNSYLCVLLMACLGWFIPVVIITLIRKIKFNKIRKICGIMLGV